MYPERLEIALLGSEPGVSLGREHQTFLRDRGSSLLDPHRPFADLSIGAFTSLWHWNRDDVRGDHPD